MISSERQKLAAAEKRNRKIVEFKDLAKLGQHLHKKNKKIVFLAGSFELITPGHCRYLSEARALGDVLVVGVHTDRSISKLHGADFPLLGQDVRMEMLSYLRVADYVTLMDEGEPHTPIVLLKPDIFSVSRESLNNGNFDEQAGYLLKMHGGRLMINESDKPYTRVYGLAEHIADVRFLEMVASYLWSKNIEFELDKIDVFKPADFGNQESDKPKAFCPKNSIYKNPLELAELTRKLKSPGRRKVVFVSGSYDLLHVGHARFIEKAWTLGNVLIVGIPSDSKIGAKKGRGRPMISEYSRAYVLGSLDCVDSVYIFDDDTVLPTLEILKPDVFFTVDESWNNGLKKSPEYKAVKAYGGTVVLEPRQSPYLSSSTIINKVALKKVREIFADCMQDEKFKEMLLEGPHVKEQKAGKS